jgi:hypothetical protein
LIDARIAGIGLKSGFAGEVAILVRISVWLRAEGVMGIFAIFVENYCLRIIEWGYDKVLEDKGHSLQL